MKIATKKDFPDFSLPPPIFSAICIADGIGKDGEEFDVFMGLDKEHVRQLVNLSLDTNDADLQNNTGDRKRFGEGSYEDWYEKNRTPFCLIHKRTNALAALIWFGPKSLGIKSIKFGVEENPGEPHETEYNWHTISCRSYPGFRGKGLMKNFTQFTMDIYRKKFSGVAFWAGMDNRNKGIIKLLSELGFEISEENSDLTENWLVMTKKYDGLSLIPGYYIIAV
jgi:hypothetical protein